MWRRRGPNSTVETIAAGNLADALRAAASIGFDLSVEPPLRAHLFALAGDEDRADADAAGNRKSATNETTASEHTATQSAASARVTHARTHVLLLLLHHIAGDGSSLMPLARDLSDAYGVRCTGGVGGGCIS